MIEYHSYMIYFSISIIAIMTVFALIGLVDLTFLKNKLGLGKEFKKGFELIGPLCLGMVGIISGVPLIAKIMEYTINPLYKMMGLDPSMAISSVLAVDMGGWNIATKIASNQLIAQWAGIVHASMMGATIVFTIPVGLAMINKKDLPHFAKGILFGIAAIPFGSFIGGVILGVPILTILLNLVPPIIFSIIIIVCLVLWPNGTTKVFKYFSIFVNIFGMSCLAIAMVKDLILTPVANTGAFDISKVPFINLFDSTLEGIKIAGSIGLVLAGTLPFVLVLNKLIKKPISKLQNKIGGTEYGYSGYIATCANTLAMFSLMDKMNDKEKVYNVAFAVSAATVIGDHLAFTSGVAPKAILPMMVAKLFAGILAIVFVFLYYKFTNKKEIIK